MTYWTSIFITKIIGLPGATAASSRYLQGAPGGKAALYLGNTLVTTGATFANALWTTATSLASRVIKLSADSLLRFNVDKNLHAGAYYVYVEYYVD